MGKIISLKKLGIGSISLILSILGAMFSFTVFNGKELGVYFLNSIGISFPVGISSLIILLIALVIGYKYKNDYLAKSGMVLATIFILLIGILTITNTLF